MRNTPFRILVVAGISVATAVSTAGVALAVNPAPASVDYSNPPAYGRVGVTFVGVGSDTTFEVMDDLDQIYNESPGCAVGQDLSPITNVKQGCLDPSNATNLLAYAPPEIKTENLYHDRAVEAFPVGSGGGNVELQQLSLSGAGAVIPGTAFARSSSTQTACKTASDDCYQVTFAYDALTVWIGKNNKQVQHNSSGVPTPRFYKGNLKNVFLGDGAGNCATGFSGSTTATDDSINNALTPQSTVAGWTRTQEAASPSTLIPYATQSSSGTGKKFAQLLGGSAAAELQNCIPTAFTNVSTADGNHVIFENNAQPICKQPNGTATGGTNHNTDQARAIYPYSFGRFVQNKAGTGTCAGVLGSVSAGAEGSGNFVTPKITTIGETGTYPFSRPLFNYFQVSTSVSGGFDITNPTTWDAEVPTHISAVQLAALDYMSPAGWICQATHANDPQTNTPIRTLMESAMKADGFAPLALGATGLGFPSSYCRAVKL